MIACQACVSAEYGLPSAEPLCLWPHTQACSMPVHLCRHTVLLCLQLGRTGINRYAATTRCIVDHHQQPQACMVIGSQCGAATGEGDDCMTMMDLQGWPAHQRADACAVTDVTRWMW